MIRSPRATPWVTRATCTRPICVLLNMIQAPDRMLIHMQYHEIWRQVWTDGRVLPKDPDPAWMGYSIGKWDGDTFVITSTGYDERTWLDHLGNPHSDQMVLVERWKHPDANTLTLDMTITDPKTYTAPWVGDTITFVRAKAAIFEELCVPSRRSFQRSHQGRRRRLGQTLTRELPDHPQACNQQTAETIRMQAMAAAVQ